MAVAAWLPLVFRPRVRWTATLLPRKGAAIHDVEE
jgi:hypothetical protein